MRHSARLSTVGLALAAAAGSVLFAPVAQAATRKVVAIAPFSSPHRYSSLGRNAQSAFITTLVKSRKLAVIQASMVQRMLRRRGLHWTGAVDPRLLKAAKRWLKADYLLAGKLRWTGGAYTLSVHVMDVRTLATTFAEDADFRHIGKMRVAVRLLARKIAAQIAGRGASSGSDAELFLNVDARAFYDTAEICLRVMRARLGRYRFTGRVAAVDDPPKTIQVSGYGAGRLRPGMPLDVYDDEGVDGPRKVLTAYVTGARGGKLTARYRHQPDDGIPLTARVTNVKHSFVVAVGRVVDQAEGNAKLVAKLRETLLEKMSDGTGFQQIDSSVTRWLARQVSRKRRFFAYRKLFSRGVEFVLDGKLYGSAGRRRAHFKLYSTLTGKVVSQLKFETKL